MTNAEQLSPEAIEQQQALLDTYRRTLAHLLQQAAQHGGEVSAPPAVSNSIYDARANIRRIKATLRAHGAPPADHPDDELPLDTGKQAPAAGMGAKIASHEPHVSVSGGTIYGPVVGTNIGTIATTYGGPAPAGPPPGPVEQALAHVQQAARHAQQRGAADLADDLSGVVLLLQVALKAQHEGKAERRAAKLHEARAALRQIAGEHAELQEIARMLERVA